MYDINYQDASIADSHLHFMTQMPKKPLLHKPKIVREYLISTRQPISFTQKKKKRTPFRQHSETSFTLHLIVGENQKIVNQ